MIEIDTMDTLREEVKSELLALDGKYNPTDRDTNVRIVEDIRKSIDDYADGVMPSAKHIAEVAIATNENLQIRDFLLGIQLEKNIDYVCEYITLLGNVIIKDKAVPLATVFCGYLYQADQKEYASEFLDDVLKINPDYPLAKLLRRVFDAQWESVELEIMAKKLHQGVLDNIYQIDNGDSNDN